MVQIQLPNSVNRILKVCLLLIGIATFVVIVIGISLVKTQNENKRIEKFLEVGKDVHVDFEHSLIMYTEKTRDTIEYLLKLRPSSDEEVIEFISKVEQIGQENYLKITLETYGELIKPKETKGKQDTGTISYKISFFGSIDDLNKFMKEIEALPYFVRFENVSFRDLAFIEKTQDTAPNISMIIKLYIKKQ